MFLSLLYDKHDDRRTMPVFFDLRLTKFYIIWCSKDGVDFGLIGPCGG